MPTYQYACTACGDELEAVQSFSDEALTVCPACGGNLRKKFSAVGIVFKGSGFYRTDSRSGSSTAGSSSTGSKSDSGSSETSTSSAAKSESSSSSSSSSAPAEKKPAAATPAA